MKTDINKATPVISTTLTILFLLSGESIKTQVCSLPVLLINKRCYQSYNMMISIAMNRFTQCFAT